MKRYLLILFLSAASCGIAFGQEMYHVGFSDNGIEMPDTVNMNQVYNIDFELENKGTQTITSSINVFLATYDEVEGLNPEHWIVGFSNIDLEPGEIFIPPNPDDIYDQATAIYNYGPGDNIVVIWPVIDIAETQTSESIYNDLYVNDPNSIVSFDDLDFEIITRDNLINVQTIENVLQVVMFDLNGRIVFNENGLNIATKSISSGIYILQVNFADGYSQSRKVMVE
ncbi:MAG: hypothetical protein CMP75_03975 [Flavobacteriales bacterium]|nr:hypothetical protein [Flavobacteriales bacterium]